MGGAVIFFFPFENLADLLAGPFKIFLVLQGKCYKISEKKASLSAEQEGFSRSWNVLLPQPPTECVANEIHLTRTVQYIMSCLLMGSDRILSITQRKAYRNKKEVPIA